MRIIFLDIDGVLNRHITDYCVESQSNIIRPELIRNLNRIILATDAKIVLSSAWRYMILGGAITKEGFGYMLRTHGVCHQVEIVGITKRDEEIPTRGEQIEAWMYAWNHIAKSNAVANGLPEPLPTTYVVIDNDDFGITDHKHPFVRTDDTIGLTEVDADQAIKILMANR